MNDIPGQRMGTWTDFRGNSSRSVARDDVFLFT